MNIPKIADYTTRKSEDNFCCCEDDCIFADSIYGPDCLLTCAPIENVDCCGEWDYKPKKSRAKQSQ